VTLALLQQFVQNAVNGWQDALAEIATFLESVPRELTPVLPDCNVIVLTGVGSGALLGQRTAEMHLALTSDPHTLLFDPAFAPEPMSVADLAALTAEVQRRGEEALQALRSRSHRIPEAHLLFEAARSLARLDAARAATTGLAKIRCHGDYHLGQVLRARNDIMIIDFEGEPTRTVAERRAKQSPLRDVAGMLRSIDYAAYAGLFAYTDNYPDEFERLEPWAEQWQQWTSEAFLREYLKTAAGAPFLPRDPDETQRLLRLFMLGKAFYELSYELNNRPDWVRIPLRGLLGLLREIDQKS
jgi:maltose alpha-D-glucosyltransferase/alpha-amylase